MANESRKVLKNYVISLANANKRRQHILTEFGRQGIDFEFFDAVTPETNHAIANLLNIDLKKAHLSQGEISCLLSHLFIWKKALDNQFDYVAVFEDDIYLGEDTNLILNNTDWIYPDWHIIKLETFYERTIINNPITHIHNRFFHRLNHAHYGAAGYILSSQAIKDLFEFINSQEIIYPIDKILFDSWIFLTKNPIIQISPALCIQEKILNNKQNNKLKLSNSLDTYRNHWQPKKQKLTKAQKFKREFIRIYYKIKLILIGKIIYFK